MPDNASLLRGLPLFEHVSQAQLSALAQFLKSRDLGDGEIIFEEATMGDSLYFVAGGQVDISKKTAEGSRKDLAVLRPGDCFGEMAVLEPQARSARASAHGPTVVLELARKDLDLWVKSDSGLAVAFFAGLVQIQSRRLRKTSSELTMLHDLSTLLLAEAWSSSQALLSRVFERILPHLEGRWSAAAYMNNVFNAEFEPAAAAGEFDLSALAAPLGAKPRQDASWIDPQMFYAPLLDAHSPTLHGFLLFRCADALSEEAQADNGRALLATARLVTSALDNIRFRNEDKMRDRLASQTHGTII